MRNSQRRISRRTRSRIGALLGGTALAVGVLAACGPVLRLEVDTASDGVDAAPGDGVCATAAGGCTLRAAIGEANAHEGFDLITIGEGIDPTLSIAGRSEDLNATGDLDVTSQIEIRGQGATIDARGIDRVIDVVNGELRIVDLEITGGAPEFAERGGGIQSHGVLRVNRSTISGNTNGAIYSQGRLEMSDTSVVDNDPRSDDGSIDLNGGVVTIIRSIVDAPGPALTGGAVQLIVLDSTLRAGGDVIEIYSHSTARVVRSTLQTTGSSWYDQAIDSYLETQVSLAGSVLDAPLAGPASRACSGELVSEGYNVIPDTTCGAPGPGDVIGSDALLEPLADNGGPTTSMRPHGGSPAIDLIPATSSLCVGIPMDQRLAPRPVGAGCDAGAVEAAGPDVVPPAEFTVDTASDAVDADPGDGACATDTGGCSLRAAVMETNARNAHLPQLADEITVAEGVDPVVQIAGDEEDGALTGDIDVTGALVIRGNGATLHGSQLDRVIDNHSPALDLHDLAVTGGSAAGDGGGIRSGPGELNVTDVAITGNHANFDGGGLAAEHLGGVRLVASGNSAGANGGGFAVAFLDLSDGTISDNTASDYGGGGAVDGLATIRRSTISGNTASWGGGLSDSSFGTATFTIESSTISGNHGGGASAVHASGQFQPGLYLTSSTVVGNTGSPAIQAVGSVCTRICYEWTASTVRGSIVVGGEATAACSGALVSSEHNLVPDGTCGTSLPGTGALGPLAANGGPTQTHLPAAGSGAIDAIEPGTAGLCDGTVATDQRGVARPTGGGCDVGAVEQ